MDNSSTAVKLDDSAKMQIFDVVDLEDPIIFREPLLPPYVKSVTGLSGAEFFGRWSEKKTVTFQFNKLLPKKFTLAINAGAYGTNGKSPAIIRAGVQERKLLIDTPNTEPKDFSVDFSGVENASSISIEVPSPTTPKSRGEGEDIRPLGYNFVTLSIRPSE